MLLLVALGYLLVMRGILPPLAKVDTDFPNYYTSAKIVADGADTSRLYDVEWFHEQMSRYHVGGNPPVGKFAPFPPPTALLLTPLAGLQPLQALRVLTVVSVLCLLGSIVLLARSLAWPLLETSLFVLLSGYVIFTALRDGQPYIAVALSCIAGYFARLKHRPLLSGVCFGLFVAIKYFPVVYVLYFAWRREWWLVAGAALVTAAIGLASVAILGPGVHRVFLDSVLGDHLVGKLSLQDPFNSSFQSFDSLFRRLFVFDALANPTPWLASGALQVLCVLVTKASILCVTAATLVRRRRVAPDTVGTSLGLLGIATLLLAPATATYHMTLLWLPLGLMMAAMLRQRALGSLLLLLPLYALIGFFPFRLVLPFDGRGGLTVLAYPRLLIMIGIFTISTAFLWRRECNESAA